MLIQINTNVVTMANYLVLVQSFHLQKETWEKNIISFGGNMSSFVHIDNKNKNILILGGRPTQVLDDTTLTAECKYCINFTQSRKRFVLSTHHNASNSFLSINATKVYQFKAKISEGKDYTLYFGNISEDFIINNVKKTGLKGNVKVCFVNFNPIDTK